MRSRPEIRTLPIVNVLIGSPGDLGDVRDAVEEAVHEWTRLHSSLSDIVLLPVRWEKDAVANTAGLDGQLEVTKQLLGRSQILIAIFGGRFGSPTARHGSGTEEEVLEAINAGLYVHLLFSQMSIPPGEVDTAQIEQVRKFRERMRPRGLDADFHDISDLRTKVMRILALDVKELLGSDRSASLTRVTAGLRATIVDDGNNEVLNISNVGDQAIQEFRIVNLHSNTGQIQADQISNAFTIGPHGTIRFNLHGTTRSAGRIHLKVRWKEQNGQYHEGDMSV